MTWTPEQAIDAARDYHPAFDRRQTPLEVARRFVDRYHRELYNRVLDREPDLFSTTFEVTFPVDPFEDGVPLPDDWNMPQANHEVHFESSEVFTRRLHLIPAGMADTPGVEYPAYTQGDHLFFAGFEEDWTAVERVVLRYAPQATQLVSKDTEADLPDRALDVAIERLALFMASRGPRSGDAQGIDLNFTIEDWRNSEQQFLHEISRAARSESTHIREVW